MEGAAGGRGDGARDLAADAGAGAAGAAGGGEVGDRVQQEACVGVAGLGEDGLAGSVLDDAAEIHDAELVRHVADDGQVMADEEVGEAEAALKLAHQVQDLRLHRDIQRAGGFVADQEVRLGGQRAGDRDALALAAAELVGVFQAVSGGQADLGEEGGDALGDGRRRAACRRRAEVRPRCPARASAG